VDPEGRIVVSTYPQRAKTSNTRRDPKVSICVLSDDFDGPWVQVYGTAEVLDMPEAAEPFVDYFRSIAGEHPDWDEFKQTMANQGKSLIRITPTSWARSPRGASRPRSPKGWAEAAVLGSIRPSSAASSVRSNSLREQCSHKPARQHRQQGHQSSQSPRG
jgi:PPOX class probable F420-dependent enzyme